MTSWTDLRTHALVGVSRRTPDALVAAGLDVSASSAVPETQVLMAAALLSAERRAGARPRQHVVAPAPAHDDPRPVAPPQAAQLLELAVTGAVGRGGQLDALLEHWFTCCNAASCRVPERLTVDVIETVTSRLALRDAARLALGESARWVARQRPDWSWVTEVDGRRGADDLVAHADDGDALIEAWSTASSADRTALIARARKIDDALARLLVESTWAVDSAADREIAIGLLATAPSAADEPLFERALDDRSKKVRAVAHRALDAMPDSARAARLAARLRPLIRQKGVVRSSLVVELPADPDELGVRDGLGEPPTKRSRRAWWLEQLVIGAPLRLWSDVTGRPVDQVVRMSVEPTELFDHWVAAAVVQRNQKWAAQLFARDPRPVLLSVLPHNSVLPIVEQHVRAGMTPDAALALSSRVAGRWPTSLTDAMVACFRKAMQSSDTALHARALWLLRELAPHLDSSAVHALDAWRAANADDAVDRILRQLIQHVSTLDAITAAFGTGATHDGND